VAEHRDGVEVRNGRDPAVEALEERVSIRRARHRDIQISRSPGERGLEIRAGGCSIAAPFEITRLDLVQTVDHSGSRERPCRELRAHQRRSEDAVDLLLAQGLGHSCRLTLAESGESGPGLCRVELTEHIGGGLCVPDEQESHGALQHTEGTLGAFGEHTEEARRGSTR